MRLSNGEVLLRWPLAQHLAAAEYDLKIIHGKG